MRRPPFRLQETQVASTSSGTGYRQDSTRDSRARDTGISLAEEETEEVDPGVLERQKRERHEEELRAAVKATADAQEELLLSMEGRLDSEQKRKFTCAFPACVGSVRRPYVLFTHTTHT